MIPITRRIALDESELDFRFVRASGPGGQNVNKVSTAVELRFDLARSPSLPDDVKDRLAQLAGRRLTQDGVLVIDAQRFRSQDMNRKDAVERLVELIRQALHKDPPRRATRPSLSAKRRRMDEKSKRGETKRGRGRINLD
ncbi:alternative ribosome rescue aminoacyl-tRNA hydrolase ArfB [Telmatospirillum sp. J64-1]|uniref:alternative ribosome rescue aminoacyl-tRNA hydrolase ArfB n=1 Tax=Telmatospirillum sp. J64-1 TaxID=2502183 RepID=UPI00115D30F8|nr:alternative ribosome rescue aminoacyl-tRNA hydrolase ArfB [Telmatospirillum sp. J64-1]